MGIIIRCWDEKDGNIDIDSFDNEKITEKKSMLGIR